MVARWRATIAGSALAHRFEGTRIVLAATGSPPSLRFIDPSLAGALGAADAEAFAAHFAMGGSAAGRRLKGMASSLPIGAARLEHFLNADGQGSIGLLCGRVETSEGTVFIAARPGLTDDPAAPGGAQSPGEETTVRRFVWRLDARDRFQGVAPELVRLFGSRAPSAAEQLSQFVSRAGIVGGETWTRLVAQRESFARLRIVWPADDGGGDHVAELWGAPTFDRDNRAEAMSGFGLVAVRANDLPAAAAADPQPEEKALEIQLKTETAAPPPQPEPQPPKPIYPTNVVLLRPGTVPNVAQAVSSEAEGGQRSPEPVTLTADERDAFREIARALGARLRTPRATAPSDADANSAPPRAQGPEPANPQAPSEVLPPEAGYSLDRGDLGALVNRLPVGALVIRGKQALFANKTLLDWLGFADVAAIDAAGGPESLFVDREAQESLDGALTLRRSDGGTTPVRARALAAHWRGAPATLIALSATGEEETASRAVMADETFDRNADEENIARASLDATSDGWATVDGSGAILALSAKAAALFGRAPEQMTGRRLASLFADEHAGVVANGLLALAAEGTGPARVEFDVDALAAGGWARPILLTLGRLEGASGARICAVFRDGTAARASAEAKEQARAEAVQASEMKSEALARISHEIRTPLHAVLGFVEVMLEERFGPIGNERYRDYLRDIHTSGEHVVSLASDLLDLARIEAGKLELRFEAVDANRVIRDCLSLLQPQAMNEHIVMRTALNDSLPPVLADERSLRQIIINLVSNAVKFNEPGGQVIVSTGLDAAGQAIIRVRDTGLGMDDEELGAALEPFRQLGDRGRGGSGLGLPLSKALAEANHAEFSIQSRKSQGTLVELAFPIARAAQ